MNKFSVSVPSPPVRLSAEEEVDGSVGFLPSAIKKARGQWESNVRNGVFIKGEEDDPANKLCFRTEPFDRSDFAGLAKRVFGPLLENESEEAKS